jgi:hypothetical protein
MVTALVPCKVTDGRRPQEATVELIDYHGKKEYFPLDRGGLREKDGSFYLPVAVVYIHEKDGAVLISLPEEADSGAHRIWVKQKDARIIDERGTA